MKHINESIIGRKGGQYRSIIIIPLGPDHTIFSNKISYVFPFKFGDADIWTGFAAEWENAEDVFMNIMWPETKIFVSGMSVDNFIKEFTHTNKHSRYLFASNASKNRLINPPEKARQITLSELRDIVKKKI